MNIQDMVGPTLRIHDSSDSGSRVSSVPLEGGATEVDAMFTSAAVVTVVFSVDMRNSYQPLS